MQDGEGCRGRGERLICVFSDLIVLGTVVTPCILHRNMKILPFCDLQLRESEQEGLVIHHHENYYVLEVTGVTEQSQWITMI